MMALSGQDRDFFFSKIHDGDVEGVCDFIDKKQEIAPFDNDKGESSAAVALKAKQLAIYEALISRGWLLNSNENFNEIVKSLEKKLRKELLEINEESKKNPSELISLVDTFLDRNRYVLPNNFDEGKPVLASKIRQLIPRKKNIIDIAKQIDEALKCELREIHTRNFIKNPNEKHLTALITRSSIYFGGSSATSNRRNYLSSIAGAYGELNEVPEIRAILKFVANIKNLDVIFDFDHDSVEHADATGNANAYGKSYGETGRVYLGAKGLNESNRSDHSSDCSEIDDADFDDDKVRSKVLGVLAHELCHVAIFRIYNNNFKPYHKDDSERLEEFERAIDDCRRNRFTEEIIALGLNELEDVLHDELSVRVPHLLALYQGDDNKIEYLRKTFEKLFKYFETKTLPDLEKENELISAVWKLKSKEPQHLTDSKIFLKPKTIELDVSENKILGVLSNCPEVTMNWIFQETTSKSNFNFLFVALNNLKDGEMYELLVNAHSSCMKPRFVIDCNNEAEKEINKIVEEMKETEIDKRIIFVHDHERFLIEDSVNLSFSHSWLDLEEQSKKNLIKKMIVFQGEKIVLEEIADPHCDSLNFVPLKELLDNYLKIGHDLKFPEIDIYVLRKFRNNKSEEIGSSEFLKIAVTSKLILLSDDPGMGKTTELKILAMELKKKLESSWVAFVDLKEYSDFYEKNENFKTEFNLPKEVANFFATKILKLNEFEEKVFEHLFCGDRVVLLLDGFDEISPSFKKFVTMLIKSIRTHSRNILITSTRPHLKNELCGELKVEAFTFMPLTEENCYEILEKNFKKKKITEKNLKKKIDQTKEFFEKLNKNSDPVKNPLIIQMIAKVFSDNKLVQDMQANTYSIYENFVKIMIMESMLKGENAREETADCTMSEFNIMTFYQKEAFKVLFENDEKKFETFFDLCFRDVQSPPEEQITRIALMKSDGSGKFQFIHRTFAEFFVADFLFKNVFHLKALKEQKEKGPMNQERMESIYGIVREVFGIGELRYEVVRSFIDGAFANLIVNIDVIDKEFLMSTFNKIFTKNQMPEKFQYFVEKSFLNLTTIITLCTDKRDLKGLWTTKWSNYFGKNIFMETAEKATLYFNTKFTELAHKVFDEKDFLNFFTEKNEYLETVVFYAYKNVNPEVFDFYLQEDYFKLAFDQFPDDFRLQLKLLRFIRYEDIRGYLDEMEKIDKAMQGLENLEQISNSETIHEWTNYLEVCRNMSSIEDFKKLWNLLRRILGENNFKLLMKKPDRRYGWTPLMSKSEYLGKEIFLSFWELLTEGVTNEEKEKILIEEDLDNRNTFDSATLNKNTETFIEIKDLYLKTFGEDKMKIMLMRERKNTHSILFVCVREDGVDNLVTIKAFWTFIQEIFDVTAQKSILMKTDKYDQTLYDILLNKRFVNDIMKIYEPFIKEHLTTTEKDLFKYERDKGWLRNYFTKKNENLESVVSLAFKNRNDPSPYDQLSDNELYLKIDSQIFKFLKEKDLSALRTELEKIEDVARGLKYFQHFLSAGEISTRGGTIYINACIFLSSMEDFEKLWNLLRRILDENDFKTLIKRPNKKNGTTPLMWKAQFRQKEIFISFWRLLTERLTNEEKEKILIEADGDGDNSFDCATLNVHHETFLAIKDLYLETLGKDKMKKLLTREGKNGESILFPCVREHVDNLVTMKALWTFIQEIFDVSTQKTILLQTNLNGNTFIDRIVTRREFNERMKIFEPFIEQHLTEHEKNQIKYKNNFTAS